MALHTYRVNILLFYFTFCLRGGACFNQRSLLLAGHLIFNETIQTPEDGCKPDKTSTIFLTACPEQLL